MEVTLLISCPDTEGLTAKISNFIYVNGGNIVSLDQQVDSSTGIFLARFQWSIKYFRLSRPEISVAVAELVAPLLATWEIHFSDTVPRIAVFIGQQSHCLLDLLWRQQSQEINTEIPLIISNHLALKEVCEQACNSDYHYIKINGENKKQQEELQIQLLRNYKIDLIVLAKYMQILSPQFITQFRYKIINVHHSLLPAFIGANPYKQAYERGVKVIGATAHYAIEDLDSGPIIEQNITHVNHRDGIDDFIRKGKDLERITLSKAIRLHVNNRILIYNNKTVVFE